MRVLVYGAGVIGSIFAYKLKNGGIDTSILARGKRLEDLKKFGLIVQDDIFNKVYITKINVVDKLNEEDYYDIILVIMQRQQVTQILPILKKNISPTIIFVGNNPSGASEYLQFVEKERILLGFGGPGGYRKNTKIIAAYVDNAILYVGEIDGKVSERLKLIETEFTRIGIKVDLSQNIDAWLKTHLALISPLAMGSFSIRHQESTLGNEKEIMTIAIKAFKENIKALKELNISILPKKYKLTYWIPLSFLRNKLLKLINSDFGKIALSGHANHAEQEMKQLTIEFFKLVENVKSKRDANRELFKLSFA